MTHTDGLYRVSSKCTILKRDEERNASSQVAVMLSVSAYDRRGKILGGKRPWNRDSGTIFDDCNLLQALHSIPSIEIG